MNTQQSSQVSSNLKKSRVGLGKVQSLQIIYLETPNSKYPYLFDYDDQAPKARKMMLKNTAVLALTKDQKFCFLKDQFQNDEKTKLILDKIKLIYCSFTILDNYYLLKPLSHPLAKQAWLDVSSLPSKLFPLRKNDVIRLGSKTIRVKQLLTHDQVIPQHVDQQLVSCLKQVYEQNQSNDPKICKTCNAKGNLNNPLIVPCKCQGNQKYIHFKFLQQFLADKIQPKVKPFNYTLSWHQFTCQTCHQKIKMSYKIDGKQYKVFTVPRPDPPYIILEHESCNKNDIKKKYLEIIPMSQTKSMCIGRSSQSNICFPWDQSLQNGHAQLIYDHELKKFLITDLNSKYGTLIKIRQSIKIRPHHQNLRVQIQNVSLDLTCKRSEATVRYQKYDQSNKIFQNQIKQQKQQDSHFFI